jgi:hypothetical protein
MMTSEPGGGHTLSERPDPTAEVLTEELAREGEWAWCLHCERAWPAGALRLMWDEAAEIWTIMCADIHCDGVWPGSRRLTGGSIGSSTPSAVLPWCGLRCATWVQSNRRHLFQLNGARLLASFRQASWGRVAGPPVVDTRGRRAHLHAK